MYHGIRVPQSLGSIRVLNATADQPTPFGVLFERDPSQPHDLVLGVLGRSGGQMTEPSNPPPPAPPPPLDATTPAGFTFFGQFVDHDITLMESPPPIGQPVQLHEVRNLRTPRLDLDSLFAGGPFSADSARFYDPTTLELRLAPNGRDIIRDGTSASEKLIPEPRNDENMIIVQLHVVFMRLYNHFLKQVPAGVKPRARYEQARRKTVLHYQNVVLRDYLPRVVGQAAIDAAIARKASRYAAMVRRSKIKLIMPLEFAFAAFRFGHTQVRNGYALNATNGRLLFDAGAAADLSGGQTIDGNLIIDWDFFFEVAELSGGAAPAGRNRSRRFDTLLAQSLGRLRPPAVGDLPVSLAERNLRRGRDALLPSGQEVARRIGIPPLAREQLGLAPEVIRTQAEMIEAGMTTVDVQDETPLWYYILREAELAGGDRLDGVGAWIVAETFIGLLLNDPNSILTGNQGFAPDAGFETMAAIAKNA